MQHGRGVAFHRPITDGLGRVKEACFITEGDMYRLIASSKLSSTTRSSRGCSTRCYLSSAAKFFMRSTSFCKTMFILSSPSTNCARKRPNVWLINKLCLRLPGILLRHGSPVRFVAEHH